MLKLFAFLHDSHTRTSPSRSSTATMQTQGQQQKQHVPEEPGQQQQQKKPKTSSISRSDLQRLKRAFMDKRIEQTPKYLIGSPYDYMYRWPQYRAADFRSPWPPTRSQSCWF